MTVHRLRDGDRGKHSRNMRWHESSKAIFAVLLKQGGPKTWRFLHETLEAPAESTVRAQFRKDKVHYETGVSDRLFEAVGKLYERAKAAANITEPVAYEIQADETTVPGASEYNQRLDSLVGTCGNKGEFHQCDVDASVVIGEGDDAYEKILQAHRTQQLAGYLSIAIIVPLCKKLPSIVICAFATCNRFTAEWVRRLWQRIEAGVAQFVSPILGPFEGHGSDGDARRAKLQWEDMHQLPKLPGRFGLDAPSFTMSARIDGDGAITGIHAQDPRHNLGKLYSHFDSTARQLHPGAAVIATHEDVRTVFETFNSNEHGLVWSTINRDDRMNKEAPARACSLKVQGCMQKLIAGRAQDPRLSQPAPQMAGSLQYVTLISRYLLIFFGKTLTNEQRIQNAGFVVGFLRRWRAYIRHASAAHVLTLQENFLPVQTYQHVILSCHSAALKLAAHAARGSSYELHLERSGSNECETTFSGLSGFGKVLVNTRNFTFGQALESFGDHTTLELYKYFGAQDPLRFGSRMHKSDVDISLHEPTGAATTSTAAHPANWRAAYSAAWTAGDAESAGVCEALGMKPPGAAPSWWLQPWQDESKDLKHMRTATADELGDEVLADGINATGELTGEQSAQRPDATHPSVAAHDADAVIGGVMGGVAGGAQEATVEVDSAPPREGEGEAEETEDEATPAAPQIFPEPRRQVNTAKELVEEPTVLNVDPDGTVDDVTAHQLAAVFERAQEEADEQAGDEAEQGGDQAEDGEEQGQASTSSPPLQPRPWRRHASATLILPAEEGGGVAYKRTIIAELNKLRPGQHRLSTDRLAKVRQAAKLMAASRERPVAAAAPAAADVLAADAGAKPTDESAPAPGQVTDHDGRLRIGSDFGMAFKEGTGKNVRWVYWLGRVRKLYKKQKRSKVEVKRPLDVEELFGGGFQVVASWYTSTPQRGSYRFNVVGDPKPYDLDHFIGLVRLDLDMATDRYELHNKEEQLQALAAATRRTEPSKKSGGKKTIGEEEEAAAARRVQQTAEHLQPQAEGVDERNQRDQRAAERAKAAQARMAAASAAGAPPKEGSAAWLDGFFANTSCHISAATTSSSSSSTAAASTLQSGREATGAAAPAQEVETAGAPAEALEAEAMEVETMVAVETEVHDADDKDVQPSPPVLVFEPPPAIDPVDPLRDLSGDAVTTAEALPRQRRGEAVWPQCSLSAARNLLRREDLPASFLAERQVGMATGELDTAVQGLRGDIRFPDWPAVLRELLHDGDTFVRFNPVKAGESSLLHDVRLMAMVFLRNTHVIAVHRDEAPDGRITFRKYDNDSDARRRGTFETVSARQLWVGSCEMVAITQRGSALHRAVGDLRPMGSLREQRVAELRAVLGGFGGLGALLPLLERAQIRSLSMLRQLSVEELRTRLNEVSGSPLSLAYLDRLPVLGLCKA